MRLAAPADDRSPVSLTARDICTSRVSSIFSASFAQEIKDAVEFSADASRGDGLRGWCKACEAEARSKRYKKRKAASDCSPAKRRCGRTLRCALRALQARQANFILSMRRPSPCPFDLYNDTLP